MRCLAPLITRLIGCSALNSPCPYSSPARLEPMVPLSTRAWIAAGLIVGGFLVGWQTQSWRMSGQLEAERARHAAYVARQQAASAEVITSILERERTLLDQIEEVSAHGERVKQDLGRQLADSDAVARRLQRQLSDLSGRISTDPGTAGECASARAAAGVLAELLGESDQLAGAFAESADRNRVAGEVCVRAYDAAREASVRD